MANLHEERCVPCERGSNALSEQDAAELHKRLQPDWKLSAGKLTREYLLKDFHEAMEFVNKVAEIAEKAWHHPDIYIYFNRVRLEMWTHSVSGLTKNDFIVAAKIDRL